jgi:hypothetical protein
MLAVKPSLSLSLSLSLSCCPLNCQVTRLIIKSVGLYLTGQDPDSAEKQHIRDAQAAIACSNNSSSSDDSGRGRGSGRGSSDGEEEVNERSRLQEVLSIEQECDENNEL